MTRIQIISDIHGDLQCLKNHVSSFGGLSIQIGDFGVGFAHIYQESINLNFSRKKLLWFAGNHDHPRLSLRHPNNLGRWGYIEDYEIFYISGEWSPDMGLRTPEIDWWEDEELSDKEMYECCLRIMEIKPRFILSHGAPSFISRQLGYEGTSRTAKFLEKIYSISDFNPEKWIFGHYHVDYERYVHNTLFKCVPYNQKYILEID